MELSSNNFQPEPSAPLTAPVTLALASLHEDLAGLNVSVADVFLVLAKQLQSITAKARELAAISREATALAGAGESDQAWTALQRILFDAGEAEALATTSRANFRIILERLEQDRRPLARMSKLPSLLNALSTLSGIETSRLLNNKVNFSALTDDIDGLGEQAEANLAAISTEADKLITLVKSGIGQLEDIKTAEGEQAATLISKTRAVLDPLRERAEASERIAHNIDEQYAAMRQATDRIVVSLQAEDIARQRVEHIQEALHRVGAQAAAGDANWLTTIVLQRSQLIHTSELLTNGLGAIVAGIEALKSRSEQLAAETSELSTQMEADKRSFEAATGNGFGAVASVFAQYSTSAHVVLSTTETLVAAVTGMTEAAESLEDIETSVRLIAVNAAIKTAQLGPEGRTMSVIATALQDSAADSKTNTQLMVEGLATISQAASDISIHGSACAGSSLMLADVKEVAATVAQLADCVNNSRSKLSGKLHVLLTMSDTLQGDLLTAGNIAEQGRVIGDSFGSVAGSFDALLQQFGGGTSVGGTEEADTAKLKELYSMQSERDVHEQMISHLADAEGTFVDSNQASDSGDSDLGDGIELF